MPKTIMMVPIVCSTFISQLIVEWSELSMANSDAYLPPTSSLALALASLAGFGRLWEPFVYVVEEVLYVVVGLKVSDMGSQG